MFTERLCEYIYIYTHTQFHVYAHKLFGALCTVSIILQRHMSYCEHSMPDGLPYCPPLLACSCGAHAYSLDRRTARSLAESHGGKAPFNRINAFRERFKIIEQRVLSNPITLESSHSTLSTSPRVAGRDSPHPGL